MKMLQIRAIRELPLQITLLCSLLSFNLNVFAQGQQIEIKRTDKQIEIKKGKTESGKLLLADSTIHFIKSSVSDSLTHYLSKGRTAPLSQNDKKKAIALSFLLPGLGDQYIGNKSTAIRFYIIEGSIWASFFGMKWFAGVLKNDYILYATSSASAHKDMNEEYYDAVEWYNNINAYNEHIREEAYARYREDREAQLNYIEENAFSDSLYWDWQTKTEWNKYINLREQNRGLLQRAGYCVGAAIINRLISAFLVSHKEQRYGLFIEPTGIKIYLTLE